ncbi:unnamed protein product [Prorocentrum cordatum]|uniref:Uncharacterized protein n=1 Tax=Prorocentrum cordatum TaxID=2364126 RepID=A0ABN9UZJ1_9DINO|nr:unnamed protein product [Polarella glacialis]
MLLPFPARVFSTLLALTLGARPAQLDGITLDSSSVHQLDSLHDSLRVPRAVSLLTVTPPNAATSTRLPQRPASDPSRLQRSATVADVADDGTACSITNGTGMNANQCRCGERWCRSRQWCISATSECLEAGTALRHAIDEHGSEAIPLIHQALDDSMVVDRREAKTAESAEDGAKCCKCKDDATTWSKSGTCTECWPSDVLGGAAVDANQFSEDQRPMQACRMDRASLIIGIIGHMLATRMFRWKVILKEVLLGLPLEPGEAADQEIGNRTNGTPPSFGADGFQRGAPHADAQPHASRMRRNRFWMFGIFQADGCPGTFGGVSKCQARVTAHN